MGMLGLEISASFVLGATAWDLFSMSGNLSFVAFEGAVLLA